MEILTYCSHLLFNHYNKASGLMAKETWYDHNFMLQQQIHQWDTF